MRIHETNSEAQENVVVQHQGDANRAVVLICRFAGYESREMEFLLQLIGEVGVSAEPVSFYDSDLAETFACNARTVRRWREAYLTRAESLGFAPLEIIRGKYDSVNQKTAPSRYRLVIAQAVQEIVLEAQAMSEYGQSRRKAVAIAVQRNYRRIARIPPARRGGKRLFTMSDPIKAILKGFERLAHLTPEHREALFEIYESRPDAARIEQIRALLNEPEVVKATPLRAVS